MAKRTKKQSVSRKKVDLSANPIDSARNSRLIENHFAFAQSGSINCVLTSSNRQIMRNRARYEVMNNAYARAVPDIKKQDIIGMGPQPRIILSEEDRQKDDLVSAARRYEEIWQEWATEVHLHQKAALHIDAETVDGEGFTRMSDNFGLRHPVKLDVNNVDADLVMEDLTDSRFEAGDGIAYDQWGNPVMYRVATEDPNGNCFTASFFNAENVPAEFMIHTFKRLRPGQLRGVSQFTPVLYLFAMLRRYCVAVLVAAESAADTVRVLSTQAASFEDENGNLVGPADMEEGSLFNLQPGQTTVLAEGWELNGFKAEQPTTTHPEFKRTVLSEIAKNFGIPYNVLSGDSNGLNYSSGRLDSLPWDRTVTVEQMRYQHEYYQRIHAAWHEEARLVSGLIDPRLKNPNNFRIVWDWPKRQEVDPKVTNQAWQILYEMGATSKTEISAARGKNYDDIARQRAAEAQLENDLNLTDPGSSGNNTENGEETTPETDENA